MIHSNGQKSLSAIGFLTVTRDIEHGWFGGYLILNPLGRPLEFHCTAPVQPNRAQQILYGPTLESFLLGERIAPTLLDKAKTRAQFVFTDIEPVMPARPYAPHPLMLLVTNPAVEKLAELGKTDKQEVSDVLRADGPHGVPARCRSRLHCFEFDHYRLAVADDHREDRDQLAHWWSQISPQIDLAEPFTRIREAIGEAWQSARKP